MNININIEGRKKANDKQLPPAVNSKFNGKVASVEQPKNHKTKKITKKNEPVSQLRQDLVTGDWVVIATGREKRPDEFKKSEVAAEIQTKQDDCVFCHPEKTGQEKDLLIYKTTANEWTLRIFPNKYPAFAPSKARRIKHQEEGPYFWVEGVGYHEVIVTHDHEQHMGQMDPLQIAEILDAYQTRYFELMSKKSVNYIEIFHNHGKSAGASIVHPHSQLAAIPVISPYIQSELDGADRFYTANKNCVYCTMLEWELEHKKRVIFENRDFVAFCPFASRSAFEVWVLPKKHKPYFERISDEEKIEAGEALSEALGKINRALNNPDYNFYLHTSPCDGKDYGHYHWHLEILPKTSIWAGFELSTGIEVSTIEPERAAEYLKNT